MSAAIESIRIQPASTFGGEVRVPGDKSISHRVAMLAGIACGESLVTGFLRSEDCLNSLNAMCVLGASAEELTDGRMRIAGCGGQLQQPTDVINVGNSGTTMRLLSGLLAGYPITVELTGDASLLSRPMQRIQDPLVQMGAKVELLGEDGRGPVRVTGGSLHGITYELPVASAQVKSCTLLAGLCADGTTTVVEPAPTRDHTERLLIQAGVPVRVEGLRIELDGYGADGPQMVGREWNVPGDISSAAYFAVAAAMSDGAEIRIRQVGLNPRRSAILDVLRRMGADIEVEDVQSDGEPLGDVVVRGKGLRGTEVGGSEIPALIDELPLVAVAGALADGETIIRDARELRVKESDRIAVMVENLRICGVDVTEHEDGLAIRGGGQPSGGAEVDSRGDHRIAMAMSVLGLFAKDPICVKNTACVSTSYPGFWDDLRGIGVHVE